MGTRYLALYSLCLHRMRVMNDKEKYLSCTPLTVWSEEGPKDDAGHCQVCASSAASSTYVSAISM